MTTPPTGLLRGRSELIMVAIIAVVATGLLIGSLTMNVRGHSVPGPTFVPYLLSGALYVLALALAVDVWRNPETPAWDHSSGHHNFSPDMLHDVAGMQATEDTYQAETTSPTDHKTLWLFIAACLVFVLVLPYVGWIIAAAALFWVSAYLLGSRRPMHDLCIAFIFSSTIQLIFAGAMGLSLPAGFLGAL